jgi:uncharacterized membrane-anchored protein
MAYRRVERPRAAVMLNKVPEITLLFWVIKVLGTTVGETGAELVEALDGAVAMSAAGLGGTRVEVTLPALA